MPELKPGDPAPTFELPASGGGTVSSAALLGRWLVLYFYPRDNTPGCTRESQDFRDLHDAFEAAGAAILGVSRDSVASHDRFVAGQRLPFSLLADTQESLCQAYGVIQEKNMYGRRVLGVERSTFLVDGRGVVRAAWRKVKVPGHAQAVLDTLRELSSP